MWLFACFRFAESLAQAADPPAGSDQVQADWFRQAVLGREAELLAAVQKEDPSYYQRLLTLKGVDETAYLTALYRVSKLVERAKDDPAFAARVAQIREKETQVKALALGFSSLTPAQQVARRAQLEKLAGELMDLKQSERRDRLAELQQRLDELQKEIDQREQQRADTVRQYVDQLVSEHVDL